MIANVLSIAGSDPSGGAGIQADIKAISANGAYAMAALTALTAQNTNGVTGVHLVPPEFVRAQVQTVFDDIEVHAIKIGMIANAAIAGAVAEAISDRPNSPIVLDPVMIAKGGAPLLEPDAIETLRGTLLPRAEVLTPNLPEAAHLLERPVAKARAEMAEQARALLDLGPRAILLKGGHLEGPESPDCLVTQDDIVWFEAPRKDTANTHGTGCTLSAALAAQMAQGHDLSDAVAKAKAYVAQAIVAADQLSVGHGHGPTHHFIQLWKANS